MQRILFDRFLDETLLITLVLIGYAVFHRFFRRRGADPAGGWGALVTGGLLSPHFLALLACGLLVTQHEHDLEPVHLFFGTLAYGLSAMAMQWWDIPILLFPWMKTVPLIPPPSQGFGESRVSAGDPGLPTWQRRLAWTTVVLLGFALLHGGVGTWWAAAAGDSFAREQFLALQEHRFDAFYARGPSWKAFPPREEFLRLESLLGGPPQMAVPRLRRATAFWNPADLMDLRLYEFRCVLMLSYPGGWTDLEFVQHFVAGDWIMEEVNILETTPKPVSTAPPGK